MVVNSVSESWGRMVSEPMSLGVPVVVRAARCASNDLAPGLTIVDSLTDLSCEGFGCVVERAKWAAPKLAAFSAARYSLPVVRARLLALLRRETPDPRREAFDRAAARPAQLSAVDELVCY